MKPATKTATKPLTIHRLSLALLTCVLLLSSCVIVSQQRDNESLRRRLNRDCGHRAVDKQSLREMELGRELAREKQINAHMERLLNDAAQQTSRDLEADACGPNHIDCIQSIVNR